MTPKVVISNGFQRYHLSAGAVELNNLGALSGLITGAYPTAISRTVINGLPFLRNHRRFKRLLDREENLPRNLIHHQNFLEYAYLWISTLRKFSMIKPQVEQLRTFTFRQYGRCAVKYINKLHGQGANIYHFRSGFGGAAADRARELDMVRLCDHTIAHPHVLQYMIENRGKMPAPGYKHPESELFWDPVLEDIDRGQCYLVNSDFVKDTFINQGIAAEKINVIYQGVDEKFFQAIPPKNRSEKKKDGPLSLLYAGTFELRKGAPELVEALSNIKDLDWELKIAGVINPTLKTQYQNFLDDPRVTYLGVLDRKGLATAMSESEIFVFPSRAEGSARVVFEAMACGCFIVTTPNSGSIVTNGEQGIVVEPGDADSIQKALHTAFTMRDELEDRGHKNALLIANKYRQSDFGKNLLDMYNTIILQHQNTPSQSQ